MTRDHRGRRGVKVHRQCAECDEAYLVQTYAGPPRELAQDSVDCCLGCWRAMVLARAAVVGRRFGRR